MVNESIGTSETERRPIAASFGAIKFHLDWRALIKAATREQTNVQANKPITRFALHSICAEGFPFA